MSGEQEETVQNPWLELRDAAADVVTSQSLEATDLEGGDVRHRLKVTLEAVGVTFNNGMKFLPDPPHSARGVLLLLMMPDAVDRVARMIREGIVQAFMRTPGMKDMVRDSSPKSWAELTETEKNYLRHVAKHIIERMES